MTIHFENSKQDSKIHFAQFPREESVRVPNKGRGSDPDRSGDLLKNSKP